MKNKHEIPPIFHAMANSLSEERLLRLNQVRIDAMKNPYIHVLTWISFVIGLSVFLEKSRVIDIPMFIPIWYLSIIITYIKCGITGSVIEIIRKHAGRGG